MTSATPFVVLCINCGKFMGNVDIEELSYVNEEKDSNLCFDCDPVNADSVPEIFNNMVNNEFIVIDTASLVLREDELGKGNLYQSHAHERARARGLSSSTKVNRSSHNTMVLPNGVECAVCPECEGNPVTFLSDSVWACQVCDETGLVAVAIVIPKWIISHEVSNV